ncbi:MAG: hypothetical protein ACI9H6_000681 [Patiriisocius sp.]|jgi:hypothetical protein
MYFKGLLVELFLISSARIKCGEPSFMSMLSLYPYEVGSLKTRVPVLLLSPIDITILNVWRQISPALMFIRLTFVASAGTIPI